MSPIIKSVFGGAGGGIDYVSNTPPSSATEGQLWYKPTNNGVTGSAGLWLWRSPYWLSATIECPTVYIQVSSNTAPTSTISARQGFNLLLEEFLIATRDPLTADGSNYWSVQGRYDLGGYTNISGAVIVINQNASHYSEFSIPLSFVIPIKTGNSRYLSAPSFTKVGTPTTLACTYSYRYREIHP